MSETKQLLILIFLTILVGGSGLVLVNRLPYLTEGDVVIDEYVATLYANGTLIEDYVYDVKVPNQYRMLYRSWDVPLSTRQLDTPYVQFIGASSPDQMIFYAKDFQGSVWLDSRYRNDSYVFGTVKSLADLNEVGAFNPQRFAARRYNVRYIFEVHPPLEYDETLCHVNLKLAGQHLAYHDVMLVIKDPGYVVSVYTRPLFSKEVRGGNEIAFRLSVVKDEPLELEILFRKDIQNVLKGFPRKFDDVKSLTVQANSRYLTQYYVAQGLRQGAAAFALLQPLIFILTYFKWGREKRFVVPTYLSTVPNKERKPWTVNLVFKGDPYGFDESGFYATLLDLHLRGKIRMSSMNEGLAIQILDQTGVDVYEGRALRFLSSISRNGVVDTNSMKELVETLTSSGRYQSRLFHLQQELHYLTREGETSAASEFVVSGRNRILPSALVSVLLVVISVSALLVLPNVTSILTLAVGTSVIPLIQSVIAVIFPPTLFGKWLGESYKEKLEWDSFKKFLSDLALIRRYAPQDLSMWGDWLVYGTALGVGDNVVKAMKELKIELPEASLVPNIPLLFVPMLVAALPARAGGGIGGGVGGGMGGGFGAGGGFGGGGAGAR